MNKQYLSEARLRYLAGTITESEYLAMDRVSMVKQIKETLNSFTKREFPKALPELMTEPPALAQTPENATADQVFDVVIENYATYNKLAENYKTWQKWYAEQKKIFDSVD